MGFSDFFKGITGAIAKQNDAKKTKSDARKSRDRLTSVVEGQDWEPVYASDGVVSGQTGGADFGRTQSPQARAYLESFLSGSNPNTMSSVTDPTGQNKKAAQLQFDKNYGDPWNNQGGWEQLHEQERELDKKPLYSVEKPQEEIRRGSTDEARKRLGGVSQSDRALEAAMKKIYGPVKEIDGMTPMEYGNANYRELWAESARKDGVDPDDDAAYAAWINKAVS